MPFWAHADYIPAFVQVELNWQFAEKTNCYSKLLLHRRYRHRYRHRYYIIVIIAIVIAIVTFMVSYLETLT